MSVGMHDTLQNKALHIIQTATDTLRHAHDSHKRHILRCRRMTGTGQQAI